jgi:hypothetical protein
MFKLGIVVAPLGEKKRKNLAARNFEWSIIIIKIFICVLFTFLGDSNACTHK